MNIFFSYCHADEELRNTLEKHLSILKRQGSIDTWHDRCIITGQLLETEIDQNLRAADVVLLLISPDFLASDYCYEIEMKTAMERHIQGQCSVIPIILRPCDWHETPFGKLMAAPTDGKPVTTWANIDEAFLDITKAIKTAIKSKASDRKMEDQNVSNAPSPSVIHTPKARTSNLRVRKEFTEEERDTFLHETFSYLANFFTNSLQELKTRNKEITFGFRQIDANNFSVIVYNNGSTASQCKITVGGIFAHGISFSHNPDASDNSCNENLSVETDGHSFYLAPMGMAFGIQSHGKQLTMQGAAEYYWDLLIRPLQ